MGSDREPFFGKRDDRAPNAAFGARVIAAYARVARFFVWACVLAIVVLSLVPGSMRPHTPMPGRMEHFVAYAGAGLFLALGYQSARQRMLGWLCLAAGSGLFEILQNFTPDRGPSAYDALASAGGLTVGLLVGALAAALAFHWLCHCGVKNAVE